ncbi:MAG: Ribosomal large subunit pseudouridine synthase B [Firmicutes bacterium ADurb.Bin456]|nr:MAG: Ribosomal large subunit pseudouridine synthase B [Firmicutes bacterium ADurb.Bin456]
MERLQKVMARAGVASRRRCEEMISAGIVRVNGEVVTEPGTKVTPDRDRIVVAGEPLSLSSRKYYILMYKPRGYITTLNDEKGRKKVTDLLRGVPGRVYPVGRLDYDSEGLLLLTNDGDLTYTLTHPRYRVPKTYLARVVGVPELAKLEHMAKGLVLEDGLTAPAKVRLLESREGNALLEIIIHEGRKRQVRRMCAYIGHPVLRLKRSGFGNLNIENMRPGQYRHLTREELTLLKASLKRN